MSAAIISANQARALIECHATGREVSAYFYAARDSRSNVGRFTADPADADALHMDAAAYLRALEALARRQFTARDGSKRPVISLETPAREGSPATYIDALLLDEGSEGMRDRAECATQYMGGRR